jgi:GDP-4-dehydro-6-deoxy-D-mannose reductase
MDLACADSVRAVVKGFRPDLVIHLAGQSSVGAGAAAGGATATWRSNGLGALNLAEAIANEAPSATMLFSSSVEVYGSAFRAGPVDETTTPLPLNTYGRSKLAAEQILADILPGEARLIIARPSNHSGAGQDPRFVIPAFAAQVRQREILVGNLDAERDFLHVEDVIDAYIALLNAAPFLERREVFNVASGRPIAIRRILERLMDISRADGTVTTDPARLRPSDIPSTTIDASRISSRTDWSPSRTLDDILTDVLGG